MVITDPRVGRQVLVDASDDYQKAALLRDRLGTLQGGSLVLLEGDAWRERREMLTSAFTTDRVAAVDDITAAHTDRVLADWPSDGTVDLQATARDLTLAVLARALFGLDLMGGDTPIHAAAADILAHLRLDSPSTYLPEWVPTPTNRRFQRAVATLHDRLDAIVDQQRADSADSGDGGGLLGTLVAAGVPTETIRDELIAFLFAGFDSTATALSCTLGVLAANPDQQASLVQALPQTVDDESVADASLSACGQVDAVLRESLRLYPPQYVLFREPLTDVSLGGYRVPAGTPTVVALWLYHHDAEFWDGPETFRPERWLDARDDVESSVERRLTDTDRPAVAYAPYGAGPRSCLGRRMANRVLRTAVASICSRYRLTPSDDLVVSGGPTLAWMVSCLLVCPGVSDQ